MTPSIAFVVPVMPRAWQRARKNGNRFFKSPESVAFELAVSSFAGEAMIGHERFGGPLAMTVVAVFPPPASWSRTKRAAALAGQLWPTGKPDCDNLFKAAADALNGIVYRDDAQIVSALSAKIYGDEPEMRIVVEPVPAGPGGADGLLLKGSMAER